MTTEEINTLTKTLRELARLVDDDVPVQSRSRRLNNTLAFAFELVESMEERPIRDSVQPVEGTIDRDSEWWQEFAEGMGWEFAAIPLATPPTKEDMMGMPELKQP